MKAKRQPTDGAGYLAKTRLTTPSGDVLANEGETCERVDPSSLGWLAEQGLIVPVPETEAKDPS